MPGLQSAESGVGSFGKALKVLALNPIMLILTGIILALKWLYDAFESTREGAEKVEQVMAGVGAVISNIASRILNFGKAIIDFYQGNWKAARDEASAAFSDLGSSMTKVYNLAVELKKKRQELERDEVDMLSRHKIAKEHLFDLKEQLADENVTAKQKLEIGKKLKEDQKKLSEEEKVYAKKDKDQAIKEIAQKYGFEEKAAIKVAEIKEALAKEHTPIEIEELRKQMDAILKFSKDAIGAEQAIGEAYNKQIDANRAAEKDSMQAEKAYKSAKKQYANEEKAAAKEAEESRKEAEAKKKEYDDAEKQRKETLLKAEQDLAKARIKGHAEEIKAQEDFGKALRLEDEREAKVEKERLANNTKTELSNRKKVAELFLLNDKTNFKLKIDLINANLALELNTLAEGDLQRQILAKKAADEITKINQEAADAKEEIDKKAAEHTLVVVKGYGTAANDIAGILGKQTLAGKLLAMASASINTFEAITGQLKAFAPKAVPGYAIAQAIATGAVGFANVAKIAAVKVPGGSSGSGSMPTPVSVTAPLLPQSSNTKLDQASINGIGNAAQGGTNRTFVLDSDIKNSAERMARINRAARLG